MQVSMKRWGLEWVKPPCLRSKAQWPWDFAGAALCWWFLLYILKIKISSQIFTRKFLIIYFYLPATSLFLLPHVTYTDMTFFYEKVALLIILPEKSKNRALRRQRQWQDMELAQLCWNWNHKKHICLWLSLIKSFICSQSYSKSVHVIQIIVATL